MLTYNIDYYAAGGGIGDGGGGGGGGGDDATAALLVVSSSSSLSSAAATAAAAASPTTTTARFRMVAASNSTSAAVESSNQDYNNSENNNHCIGNNIVTTLSNAGGSATATASHHQQQQNHRHHNMSSRTIIQSRSGEIEPLLPGITGQSSSSSHHRAHQSSSSVQVASIPYHHNESYNGANANKTTIQDTNSSRKLMDNLAMPGTSSSLSAGPAADIININMDHIPVTSHRANGAIMSHQRNNSGESISSNEEERSSLLLSERGHHGRATVHRTQPSQIPLRKCILLNLLAFLFVSLSMIINLLVISIIHERVPMDQPHLPDFAFDILPDHRHFLDIAEYVIVIQTFCIGVLLFFHRHRSTILRRICIIMAIIYCFRAICMFPTQLSLASKHYICSPQLKNSSEYANMTSLEFVETIVSRVFYMSLGMGLSINGHHTFCGDYIFSGHTVILILSYLIQQEYLLPSRRRTLVWKCVDLIQFFMTLTSILCILIARGHYTIDIIIAYFVTTRIFWIYHTLCSFVSASTLNWPGNYLKRVWWWEIFLFLENIPTNQHPGQSPNALTPSTSSYPHYHHHHHKSDYQELSPSGQANQVQRIFEWPLPWPKRFATMRRNAKHRSQFTA